MAVALHCGAWVVPSALVMAAIAGYPSAGTEQSDGRNFPQSRIEDKYPSEGLVADAVVPDLGKSQSYAVREIGKHHENASKKQVFGNNSCARQLIHFWFFIAVRQETAQLRTTSERQLSGLISDIYADFEPAEKRACSPIVAMTATRAITPISALRHQLTQLKEWVFC